MEVPLSGSRSGGGRCFFRSRFKLSIVEISLRLYNRCFWTVSLGHRRCRSLKRGSCQRVYIQKRRPFIKLTKSRFVPSRRHGSSAGECLLRKLAFFWSSASPSTRRCPVTVPLRLSLPISTNKIFKFFLGFFSNKTIPLCSNYAFNTSTVMLRHPSESTHN
jgi:hypothetical protein